MYSRKAAKSWSVMVGAFIALFISLPANAQVFEPRCDPASGCVLRESGSNAQWWADSWHKAKCTGHNEEDWVVTYKTDNDTWRTADVSRVRFYAAWWSKARWWKWSGKLQAEDNVLPGITLCVSGVLSSNDIQGTYVWLKP
jgi:hypothetical protein